jgi:Ca-activated chloride channel family protein
VTALYEIVPTAASLASSAAPMLSVKLSHANAESGRIETAEQTLGETVQDLATAPADLKFAIAVAEFGLILRGSPHSPNANLASVLAAAKAGRGHDTSGDRAGFVELVRKAQALVARSG